MGTCTQEHLLQGSITQVMYGCWNPDSLKRNRKKHRARHNLSNPNPAHSLNYAADETELAISNNTATADSIASFIASGCPG